MDFTAKDFMNFIPKRVQVICNQLQQAVEGHKVALTDWQKKDGLFFRPEEADKSSTPWEAFDSATMHWYGPDKHYWFRTQFTMPQEYEGKTVRLWLSTQLEGGDDACNPQFLLFVNGKVTQGMDVNHRDVLLAEHARAGETYQLDLQAYTGVLHHEFRLSGTLVEVDREVEGLYYDLQVPIWAFPRMREMKLPTYPMEKVLNDAVNMVDLRQVPSQAFSDSVREARAYLKKALYEDLAGHDDAIATCIGHTHIDVAWLWTVSQTREKAARSFSTVLKLMDEYPEYKFMSSQPQLYVYLKERYPEVYAQIKRRVEEGRWEPEGGMWLEADCNLTSGESLVRQFLYGKRFFKEEFGVDSKILWLPDVFGYSGALPQIMKKCGVDYFMTTKLSWNQVNEIPADTLRWRGIDGTEVLTHFITTLGIGQPAANFFTTYNGMLHPDAVLGAWERYQNKDLNKDVLIAYGYGDGGGGPTREMLETHTRMETGLMGLPKTRQEFAGKYFQELEDRVWDDPRLPVWEGEFYFEYHRGTYTSMARNKRGNRKSEFLLMNLELLSVLAGDKVAYPAEALERLWKNVLLNQFHDILPGSAIKEVYDQTKVEYEQIAKEGGALLDQRYQSLVQDAPQSVTLFNTTGFARNDVVFLGQVDATALEDGEGNRYPVQQTEEGAVAYVKGLPSKGWKTFKTVQENPAESPFILEENRLETPFYTVELAEDGSLARLYDKENHREVFQPGAQGNALVAFEDKPMNFDNWDVDSYYKEKSWPLEDLASLRWTELGPVRATLEVERRYSASFLRQKIHFYAGSRRIDFDTYVDWHEDQQLLKVQFPLLIHGDEASFDIQFGNVTRKVHKNTSWEKARFESCGQRWADLSEGRYGVSLLNDCKYGHSVENGVLSLSLIKCGREPNPQADREEHVFTYALYPHKGGWREGGTQQEAIFLNLPVHAVAGQGVQETYSLVSTSCPHVTLETVKAAEDGDGIILRMYEHENARGPVDLTFGRPLAKVEECDLLENVQSQVAVDGACCTVETLPYEIKTLRIHFA